jgi:hypothetical protein
MNIDKNSKSNINNKDGSFMDIDKNKNKNISNKTSETNKLNISQILEERLSNIMPIMKKENLAVSIVENSKLHEVKEIEKEVNENKIELRIIDNDKTLKKDTKIKSSNEEDENEMFLGKKIKNLLRKKEMKDEKDKKKKNFAITNQNQNANIETTIVNENKDPIEQVSTNVSQFKVENNETKIIDNNQENEEKKVSIKQSKEENQKSIDLKGINKIKDDSLVEDNSCSRNELSSSMDSNQKSSQIINNSYSSQSTVMVGEVGSPVNTMIYSNSVSSLPSAITINKPSRYIFKKNHNYNRTRDENGYKQKRSTFPSNKIYSHPYSMYYKSSNIQEGISTPLMSNSKQQMQINSNSYEQYYPSYNLSYRRLKKNRRR